MNAGEIREARRELKRFEKELRQVVRETERSGKDAASEFGSAFKKELNSVDQAAKRKGKTAASGFGKAFKAVAKEAALSAAKGFFEQAGGALWNKLASRKGKEAGKSFSKSFKGSASSGIKAGGGLKALFGGPLALGMMGVVGAGALAGAAVSQFKGAMEQAIEQEQLTVSFDALSEDGEGGGRIFQTLREEALRTGADIADMADNVRKMMANGMDEAGAIKLNASLLDIGGATGMASHEIGLLGNALAQVAGKGVAQMEELRGQIGEKGVPVFEALREAMDLPDLNTLFGEISAGNVSAEKLLSVFQNMEGPFSRFAGGADRLGGTLGGLLARMKQEFLDVKREFAEDLAPELKPFLEDILGKIRSMKESAAGFGAALGKVIGTARAVVSSLSFTEMFQLAGLELKRGLIVALNAGAKGAQAMMAILQGDKFATMMEQAALRFRQAMMNGLRDIFTALQDAANPDGPKLSGFQLAAASVVPGYAIAKRKELKNTVGGQLGGKMAGVFQNFSSALEKQVKSLDNVEQPSGKDIGKQFVDEFKNASDLMGLSDEDKNILDGLHSKIAERRANDLAERDKKEEKPEAPEESKSSGGSSEEKEAFSGGIVAGGVANALSRLSGGPNTILMGKQLKAQEATTEAVDKNTEETKKLRDEIKKVNRGNSGPTTQPATVL